MNNVNSMPMQLHDSYDDVQTYGSDMYSIVMPFISQAESHCPWSDCNCLACRLHDCYYLACSHKSNDLSWRVAFLLPVPQLLPAGGALFMLDQSWHVCGCWATFY